MGVIRCEPPKPLPKDERELKRRAEAYASKVLAGKIPACRWVKLAIERDARDREREKRRGAKIRFNPRRAFHAVMFFGLLRHSKGKDFAGKPFLLSNWQTWATYVMMGWERKNEEGQWVRRFTSAYFEVARKNGKSSWAAAVGLYLFWGDREPGAEVYVAATKRDQACIVHSEASRMVRGSPALRPRIAISRNNLHHDDSGSKYEPLGADADTLDGLNPNGVIVDELHAHKTREMWDVLETALGARSQPLMFAITTAGTDDYSPCGQIRKHGIDILTGVFEEDTRFVLIYTLDEEDDFTDEHVWIKANPNLGVSVKIDYLRAKVLTAKNMLVARNPTLRLHFNRWTKQKDLAIDMELWNKCSDRVDVQRLAGRSCFNGLDLAKTSDFCAYVQLFAPEDESELWQIVPHFWITEYALDSRSGIDREYFNLWKDQKLITVCDGNVHDYPAIEDAVLRLQEANPGPVAYDPWNATASAQRLQNQGIQCKEFKQGILNYNEPTKTLLDMVRECKFAHGGHSVLKWMASNLEVKVDANNNMRPVKPDGRLTSARIDGMTALIMALGLSITEQSQNIEVRVF